jgi:hypothetical protein
MLLQCFDRIATDDAHISDGGLLQLQQQTADAGAVHFNPYMVALRLSLGHKRQRVTHPESDFHNSRRPAPEHLIEIAQILFGDYIGTTQALEGLMLSPGHSPLTAHIAADLAMKRVVHNSPAADNTRHDALRIVFASSASLPGKFRLEKSAVDG